LDTRIIATSGLLPSVWLAGSGHAGAQVTLDPPSRVDGLPVVFIDPVGAHPVRTPGVREANPLMAKLVERPAGFVASNHRYIRQ